jgi:predicted nuclease of restriction endonuclease-like (RecB) superfamily
LLGQLHKFLTELGWDFCFVGSEFPLQVGERNFAFDLLFFHRGLNCLVVIELMVGRLRAGVPGDAGPGRARAAQEPDHQRAAVREQGR